VCQKCTVGRFRCPFSQVDVGEATLTYQTGQAIVSKQWSGAIGNGRIPPFQSKDNWLLSSELSGPLGITHCTPCAKLPNQVGPENVSHAHS
jgi:hypothetical protein